MGFRSSALVVVSFAALLNACSSSSSSDGAAAGTTNIALADVPALLATTECGVVAQCYGAAESLFLQGRDCVSYETDLINSQGFAVYPTLVSSMKITYDGTQVQACADAITAAGCSGFGSNDTPAVCKKVFVGTTAVGGSCTEDDECADDGVCLGKGTCPGVCTARVPAGSPCTHDSACVEGLLCALDATGMGSTCVAPAAAGQACGQGMAPCGAGTICVGSSSAMGTSTPGTCKAPQSLFVEALGTACNPESEDLCVVGAFCDGA